jgi:hypothetical protein
MKSNGQLNYVADSKGNRVPDFSHVGYMNSEKKIPGVKVVKTCTALSGDNLTSIQNAVKEVEAMPADADGIRGAILLKAGEYKINGTIKITKGGVVLRGEGFGTNGTRLIAALREQHTLISFDGSSGISLISSSKKKITDTYVPIGSNKVTVETGHTFKAGDEIVVQHMPTDSWISMLEMNNFAGSDTGCNNWTSAEYVINYYRIVKKVEVNTLTFDAPVVDPIDSKYASGYVFKCTFGGIQQVGIENVRLTSEYTNVNDELHGWNAIELREVKNGWVKNVEAYHFGYSAVTIASSSIFITVDSSKCIDPISQTTGGRKYSFNNNGQRSLFMNCYTRKGRHDYVTGSKVAGPNVFLRCDADTQKADIGPHHRWATGLLFDNVSGDGEMNIQNRLCSGSGHGWAGAQTMFWNCTAKKIILQSPPEHINWAIGCKSSVTGVGTWFKKTGYIGFVEQTGKTVTPQSLFEKQLAERMTTQIVGNSYQVGSINKNISEFNIANKRLTFTASLEGSLSFKLLTANGKCVFKHTSNILAGKNTFNINQNVKPGIYFCMIDNGVSFELNKIAVLP